MFNKENFPFSIFNLTYGNIDSILDVNSLCSDVALHRRIAARSESWRVVGAQHAQVVRVLDLGCAGWRMAVPPWYEPRADAPDDLRLRTVYSLVDGAVCHYRRYLYPW